MAEEGQVISVHTPEEWNQHFQKGNDSKKLVVVSFTASGSGPCQFIAPILAEFARKMPNVIFLKVDVDELKSVAENYAVESTPTFMFLKEGKIVDKVVGTKKEELQLSIAKHAAATPTATDSATPTASPTTPTASAIAIAIGSATATATASPTHTSTTTSTSTPTPTPAPATASA